jgi:NAD(P)-dependent dehydrogenase (short-subunit alcohol dehydrogenase family)
VSVTSPQAGSKHIRQLLRRLYRYRARNFEFSKKLNLEQRIPLHREGTPAQVASLITELVTNDYITGETFTIDGGLTMRIA